jgi:hypothetical protein
MANRLNVIEKFPVRIHTSRTCGTPSSPKTQLLSSSLVSKKSCRQTQSMAVKQLAIEGNVQISGQCRVGTRGPCFPGQTGMDRLVWCTISILIRKRLVDPGIVAGEPWVLFIMKRPATGFSRLPEHHQQHGPQTLIPSNLDRSAAASYTQKKGVKTAIRHSVDCQMS